MSGSSHMDPEKNANSMLTRIVKQRRLDVAEAKAAVPADALRAQIAERAPAGNFEAAVRAARAPGLSRHAGLHYFGESGAEHV